MTRWSTEELGKNDCGRRRGATERGTRKKQGSKVWLEQQQVEVARRLEESGHKQRRGKPLDGADEVSKAANGGASRDCSLVPAPSQPSQALLFLEWPLLLSLTQLRLANTEWLYFAAGGCKERPYAAPDPTCEPHHVSHI